MKPILFSTPMVQAILGERKTQTRRVAKNIIPPSEVFCIDLDAGTYGVVERAPDGGMICQYEVLLPYKPGDVLWVRETWAKLNNNEYLYMATDPDVNVSIMRHAKNADGRSDGWMSPISMSREAARLFLRVTSISAERVQDIMKHEPGPKNPVVLEGVRYGCDFIALWDSLNAKRGYGWDKNPWVWVIGFERINGEGRP